GTAPRRVPGVVRTFGGREVGDVVPGPGACVLVPPDQLLALAPRPSLRIGGGPAVEDPPTGGPGPPPGGGAPGLVPAERAAPGLVKAVRVDPGVDPAPAVGRAVAPHLGEGGQRPAGALALEVAAVDLGEHRLGVGFSVLGPRVVPGEFEDRPVAR